MQTAMIWPKSLAAGPNHLDIQVVDLLAQRVAIETQQVGGAYLVAAGRRQCGRQQRILHFT